MAGRRLSPEERALWSRVAGSVRALRPVARALDAQTPVPKPTRQRADVLPTKPPAPVPRPVRTANALDGSWDKAIGRGQLRPEITIDLHGYTVAAAHQRLERGLADAVQSGVRVILLVTGRPPRADASRLDMPLRGIIRSSVGAWLAVSPHAGDIAAVRNAHPRHGGAGALYIVLRRHR